MRLRGNVVKTMGSLLSAECPDDLPFVLHFSPPFGALGWQGGVLSLSLLPSWLPYRKGCWPSSIPCGIFFFLFLMQTVNY